jgi:valyl-tRNA synthetase
MNVFIANYQLSILNYPSSIINCQLSIVNYMELSTRYSAQAIEDKWYAHWLKKGYFHNTPDEREPYSIVIPPPNVTGVLHMGHMLNNTIQDILARKARLEGKNVCWVPGTDHASIATEAKVVKMLAERGIKKSDLTREQFLEYAWEWKEKYGGIILMQLQKLGASCDWERTAFTMDETRYQAVIKVFVDLYKKGKIYRGYRMVNWDSEAKTVLSNEEVIHGEEQAKLYHIKYFVENSDEYVVIATQRPETLMGDTAVAVHPKDPRYAHLRGKKVIVPLVNRAVPLIFDDYVDIEFGTGALKVTPAHDQNDYELGQKHKLEIINTLNEDGTLNENAVFYIGKDRFEARKRIGKDLDAAGILVKTEDYKTNIGRSERTGCVVEPRLSLQWYVDMKKIAQPALDAVMTDDIEFFPKNQKNTYRHWMENIRDWCISRQLWWGQRVPAWYYEDKIFVAETADEALVFAQKETGKQLTINDLRQDEDALDTWFSSWLWPISVFDGFNPESRDFKYYYPTNVVVTGWDIIFLWIARMAMAGFEWAGEKPFKHVYFTGMVRDKQRRKMSKSLGNSPDALKLIEDFGADGVRFGMLSSSPAGGDLLFDEKLCEQGRAFCNKLWNALRLIKGWEVVEEAENEEITLLNNLAYKWLNQKMQAIVIELESDFQQYRLSEALIKLYSFIWDDFCSWYLEMVKPEYGKPIDKKSLTQTITIFSKLMTLLHPFMPFVSEEIWHQLKKRKNGDDCCISTYPTTKKANKALLQSIETAKEVISKVRDTRNSNGLSPKEPLKLYVQKGANTEKRFAMAGLQAMITKLANISELIFTEKEPENSVAFVVGTEKYFVALNKQIDIAAEREKLTKELDYLRGFVKSVQGKLSNERFVGSAPAQVVDAERKKLADGLAKIANLEESLGV